MDADLATYHGLWSVMQNGGAAIADLIPAP
jgi:hypothetical protein